MWLTGPVAPQHVGSSQTRAQTRVPCTGRQTLNHCTTREAPNNFFLIFIYLFIWLFWVLVAASEVFAAARGICSCGIGMWDLLVAACGIFSCGMQTLNCGMWDLVPRPGIEPRSPALGAWSLGHWTTREVPLVSNFLKKIFLNQVYFGRYLFLH